ncbi:MAG: DNA mismatch repair endonuclease MutL [Kofleriaceae bacterium]|nr:DNA mismatch repair endonuclease MutL [Kofleriaceae bacterium]
MSIVPVIAILPDHVVDQIAAGEVIERPASVVKELVDNALDAGARTITVEVEQGGRTAIRVIDDGCGIAPAQVAVAVKRHATSKIRSVDDLSALQTKGFRGEALPTIASVSRFVMISRTVNQLAATRLRINGGDAAIADELGAPVGTRIEVADLLWNVPARQKFLKGHATEAAHITDTVTRAAMAHPQVHFRLRHDGRMALDVPATTSLPQRVLALLPARMAGQMIVAEGRQDGIGVMALVAPPELSQTTARGVQLFVDRRAIRDRSLLHAVTMAYGELIPRGRYPVAVVFVDPVPGTVDYNVHPQKSEVRFSDAASVQAAVRHVLRSAIAKSPWVTLGAPRQPAALTSLSTISTLPPVRAPAVGATPLAQRFAAQLSNGSDASWASRAREAAPQAAWPFDAGRSAALGATSIAASAAAIAAADDGEVAAVERQPPLQVRSRSAAKEAVDAHVSAASAHAAQPTPGFFAQLRYLGQLDLTYLVCEAAGELVLIDQHAAHERVAYARLKARSPHHAVAMQRMLLPTTIEVSLPHVALVSETQSVLARIGYEVEVFGVTAIAIKAVPAELRQSDPAAVLRELLDEWLTKGASRAVDARLDNALATIACHSVVRAGDRLNTPEVEALLQSLDGVDFRAYSPHGRPALLRISVEELARRFGRS